MPFSGGAAGKVRTPSRVDHGSLAAGAVLLITTDSVLEAVEAPEPRTLGIEVTYDGGTTWVDLYSPENTAQAFDSRAWTVGIMFPANNCRLKNDDGGAITLTYWRSVWE